jgi:hypothetical protein
MLFGNLTDQPARRFIEFGATHRRFVICVFHLDRRSFYCETDCSGCVLVYSNMDYCYCSSSVDNYVQSVTNPGKEAVAQSWLACNRKLYN